MTTIKRNQELLKLYLEHLFLITKRGNARLHDHGNILIELLKNSNLRDMIYLI